MKSHLLILIFLIGSTFTVYAQNKFAPTDQVHYAAFNERATVRATPNDPEYFEQWHMNLINAPEVWDFTTGGLTPLGDTIVIATMEACDTQHEDIQENIWRNYLEIPNNGIEIQELLV